MSISPLEEGEIVEITKMLPGSDCEERIFVKTTLNKRSFGFPLEQLEPINVSN